MGHVLATPVSACPPVPVASLVGRSESWPLLDGDAGTAQTIELIRRAWRDSQVDPYVRATALRILQGVPPHDDYRESKALFDWVLRNIRFTKDPVDFETVSGARWTLSHRAGDCDDINAVLLPSLLSITGHPVRLVTVANIPAAPDRFSHVYCEVRLAGQWVPVDAARSNARFGVGPSRVFRKRVWSLTDRVHQDLRGGLSGQQVSLGWNWDTFADILQTGTAEFSKTLAQIKWGKVQTCDPRVDPNCEGPLQPSPEQQAAAQQAAAAQKEIVPGMTNNALLAVGGGALVLALLMKK